MHLHPCCMKSSSSSFIFKTSHFFHAQLGLDVFPDMRSLHISLNTTHSESKPSLSISSSTHSLQVFLPLPAHLTPATTTFLHDDTQSSPLLRSTCPNHLNLPCLTTSATLWTPKDCTNPHCIPILQRHPAHPSHHHPFRPLQTLQICFLHRPGFSPIF